MFYAYIDGFLGSLNDAVSQCVLKMAPSLFSVQVFRSILSIFLILHGIASPVSSQ